MSTGKVKKRKAEPEVAIVVVAENPNIAIISDCPSAFTEEEAITTLNTFFTPGSIPKIATYIKADNGNYNTYVCNNRECAAGHFHQVGVSDVNGNFVVKFLFEDPAPVTMFISKVPLISKQFKIKKGANISDNFTERCTSFATKHHFSGDDINTISEAYLQSLLNNEEFKHNNPETNRLINDMMRSTGKYVTTIINGMVTPADIENNVGPFGDPIKSVKIEANKFVADESAMELGGTRRTHKKRRKTKRIKHNKSKRRKPKSRRIR